MIDGYGRKINYLRLSITDRCNLRCQYCMPEEGVEKLKHSDILSLEEIDEMVSAFVSLGINKIRVTGGEPLVRNGIVSLIEMIRRHPEIKDLALTTNGLLLKQMAKSLKEAGLDRVNVSLDSLKPEKYFRMTRGGSLETVLSGIEEAKRVGLTPIKLNVVIIGGFNDDEIVDFVRMTEDEAIDVRFIELMPIGEVAKWSIKNYLPNKVVLEKVPELIPVVSQDPASPAQYYKLPNGKGKVGLISPISCKFCTNCNRIRLTSEGKLKYCLHSDEEFDLKKALSDKLDLTEYIQQSILNKPLEHHIGKGDIVMRNMVQVGG
ncbi:GTP 3',8-cyclase MoaA [Fusibacter sp. 3D3]|uniref:GTP 3',8-cyclase MoaA n=1 Tax=Fusibacter sp. 3D3 TaxID=1048380 RepID=UPI000853BDD0|nr:GTP 3',8-cyclase MoaA [Fusibacter sp. 3D3]GAU76775.1 molybdenum cofactor biosynthesis protein MoaA [Fusibacter sp. 3D3]